MNPKLQLSRESLAPANGDEAFFLLKETSAALKDGYLSLTNLNSYT